MNNFFTSDFFLFPLFISLGVFGFGWVIYPELGSFATLLSSGLGVVTIGTATLVRWSRIAMRSSHRDQ